jgi:hypothetical protein
MRRHHREGTWHLPRGGVCSPAAIQGKRTIHPERAARLRVCDETVPADLFVDGSRPTTMRGLDGPPPSLEQRRRHVDTALDEPWVRTQWCGGYQCTELAHRYCTFAG